MLFFIKLSFGIYHERKHTRNGEMSSPAHSKTGFPWEYLAGDKGYKRCDHVAKKPDPRCGRVSDDGVVASEACPKTCGTCG